MQLTSTDGKTVVYNGHKMKIFTALRRIYETQEINSATINGRVVRFSNADWRYVDEIPQHLLAQTLDQYDRDAERMFYNGNVIHA
jgi:hypothetical protein